MNDDAPMRREIAVLYEGEPAYAAVYRGPRTPGIENVMLDVARAFARLGGLDETRIAVAEIAVPVR